jgi:hypothetical protein
MTKEHFIVAITFWKSEESYDGQLLNLWSISEACLYAPYAISRKAHILLHRSIFRVSEYVQWTLAEKKTGTAGGMLMPVLLSMRL